ncbi:uncharacterized protein EV420DRAFT_1480822 [Desarmillaria tabescens]|uniref:Uncharacterized protein n=1 Tax=Armillaria tabescens TaxID=1929756 RepID=A0AA39N483_ARMTA|nr:uncharacterized protein EV420DRAFT_1480822 [Desarmillaria tabescens]KAK0457352.1 hypothetical protein EV420DRAFT_1480822 [Desarmillaria tabescens]
MSEKRHDVHEAERKNSRTVVVVREEADPTPGSTIRDDRRCDRHLALSVSFQLSDAYAFASRLESGDSYQENWRLLFNIVTIHGAFTFLSILLAPFSRRFGFSIHVLRCKIYAPIFPRRKLPNPGGWSLILNDAIETAVTALALHPEEFRLVRRVQKDRNVAAWFRCRAISVKWSINGRRVNITDTHPNDLDFTQFSAYMHSRKRDISGIMLLVLILLVVSFRSAMGPRIFSSSDRIIKLLLALTSLHERVSLAGVDGPLYNGGWDTGTEYYDDVRYTNMTTCSAELQRSGLWFQPLNFCGRSRTCPSSGAVYQHRI